MPHFGQSQDLIGVAVRKQLLQLCPVPVSELELLY
jgi:hypothetical protein